MDQKTSKQAINIINKIIGGTEWRYTIAIPVSHQVTFFGLLDKKFYTNTVSPDYDIDLGLFHTAYRFGLAGPVHPDDISITSSNIALDYRRIYHSDFGLQRGQDLPKINGVPIKSDDFFQCKANQFNYMITSAYPHSKIFHSQPEEYKRRLLNPSFSSIFRGEFSHLDRETRSVTHLFSLEADIGYYFAANNDAYDAYDAQGLSSIFDEKIIKNITPNIEIKLIESNNTAQNINNIPLFHKFKW